MKKLIINEVEVGTVNTYYQDRQYGGWVFEMKSKRIIGIKFADIEMFKPDFKGNLTVTTFQKKP